jgi:hypothetical protein
MQLKSLLKKIHVKLLCFKCALAKKKKRKRMIRQMLNWKRNVVLAYNVLRIADVANLEAQMLNLK